MKRGTGGIIGPQNSATVSSASGAWALWEQQKSQGLTTWPTVSPLNDTLFQYVIALLSGSGTNNANNNTFIDSSSNVTVTATGTPIQGSLNPYENGYFSNYFDGASDYVRRSGAGVLTASGDVTIECWVFPLSTTVVGIFDGGPSEVSILRQYPANNVGRQGVSQIAFTMNANTWYHFAFTNNSVGAAVTIFINGAIVATGTFGGYAAGNNFDIGAINSGGDGSFNGYISNFRVSKTILYTSTFTPSTSPLSYNSTTSLLTSQSNRFIDNSINVSTLTRSGETSVEKFSPFGGRTASLPLSYSQYFAGSAYLSAANNSSIQLGGTSNYTIEFWAYLPSASGTYGLFNKGSDYGLDNDSNRFVYRVGGGNAFVINGGLDVGTWTHIALVQTPSGVILYKNGTSIGSAGAASISNSSSSLFIGYCQTGAGAYFTGYISNFRIVKSAVYTANFTVPTSPLTNIANTGILTCQSNYVVDNSSNNIQFTYTNNTTPMLFNPFGFNTTSQSAYTTTDFGGSIFFNGAGNYLETSTGSGFSFGTGDFTIEAWIKWTSLASETAIMNGNGVGWTFYIYPANKLQWGTTSPLGGANLLTGSTTLQTNVWYHIAVTRTSNTLRLWVNGALDGSTTDSNNYSASGVLQVARSHSGNPFTGYMSNVRIVKGTGIYTAPFIPTLTPLTNITNTSILLNGTNASIIDAAAINNIQTVGNAKISTAQSKYGAGSMYFEGTDSYLSILTENPDYLRSSNWTIEFWVYPNVTSSGCVLYLNGNTGSYAAVRLQLQSNAMSLLMSSDGSNWAINTGNIGTVSQNTWTYITLVKSATTLTIYINGTALGSSYTVPSSLYTGTLNYVGAYRDGGVGAFFNGYINDLRITKYVRYSGNFSPPNSPLPLF